MKVLLHICCGPCAIYSVNRLRERGDSVEGFFYNPNIHPASEYTQRKESVVKLSESMDFRLISFRDFQFEDFFRKVSFHEQNGRCSHCWLLRLSMTAEYASKNQFDGFSTTLLISPYQDHEKIKEIATRVGSKYSVTFAYEDFRKGFSQSQKASREMGLYRQKYCGCIYSERERHQKVERV